MAFEGSAFQIWGAHDTVDDRHNQRVGETNLNFQDVGILHAQSTAATGSSGTKIERVVWEGHRTVVLRFFEVVERAGRWAEHCNGAECEDSRVRLCVRLGGADHGWRGCSRRIKRGE